MKLSAAGLLTLTSLVAVTTLGACGGGTSTPTPASVPSPAVVACSTSSAAFPVGAHPSLSGSNACFDAGQGLMRITADTSLRSPGSTGSADDDKEGFYWNLPAAVKTLRIDAGVTLTGHLRMSTSGQLIEGADRATSRIFGTNTKAWSHGPDGVPNPGTHCASAGQPAQVAGDDRVHDCEKWKYGAISVLPEAPADGVYRVANLSIENARSYAITAITHRMEVDRVLIRNTRPGNDYRSNSDGFGAGPNSVITNSKIDTWDDGIKLYSNGMRVENVTLVHNLNGAPLQLGWSDKPALNATLVNVKVVQKAGTDNNIFNLPMIANSAGKVNTGLLIAGLAAHYAPGTLLRAADSNVAGHQPMPLVLLGGASSVLVMVSRNDPAYGGPHIDLDAPADFSAVIPTGGVMLDGRIFTTPRVLMGDPARVTGCADCP